MADCYTFVCPDHDEVQVNLEALYVHPEDLDVASESWNLAVEVSVAALCPFCYRVLAAGTGHIELKEV